MIRWEHGVLIKARESWPGVQRWQVRVTSNNQEPDGEVVPALSYPDLVGILELGDEVVLNTNALRRGLGTGGEAMVVAPIPRGQASETREVSDPAGHMMKMRYSPVQTMVDAVDDPASPHHQTLQEVSTLTGMPVVFADLHSALPAIVAGIRMDAPTARIVHVHTDTAALPAAYSRTAHVLREHGYLHSTISVGQSFGGDLEAVTVHSALLAARSVLEADVVIAVQGPGNLGSGTPWGFSGLQAVEIAHATHALGGKAIAALRVSSADPRQRHRGLSHHSATALGAACFAPVTLVLRAVTDPEYEPFDDQVREAVHAQILDPARPRGIQHQVAEHTAQSVMEAIEQLPVTVSTMGRGLSDDPAAFLYPALAGRHAAALIGAA